MIKSTPEWDKLVAATEAAFEDPRVGDRFSEMYTFWVYVVDLGAESVTVMEGSGHPSQFPARLKSRIFTTRAEFRAAYAYPSQSDYWVKLADRGNDVASWLAGDPALELEAK